MALDWASCSNWRARERFGKGTVSKLINATKPRLGLLADSRNALFLIGILRQPSPLQGQAPG